MIPVLLSAALAILAVPPVPALSQDPAARFETRRLQDRSDRRREQGLAVPGLPSGRTDRSDSGIGPGGIGGLERRMDMLERRIDPGSAATAPLRGFEGDLRQLDSTTPEGRDRARQRALEERARQAAEAARPDPLAAPLPLPRGRSDLPGRSADRLPPATGRTRIITPAIPETDLRLEDLGPPPGTAE